MPTNSFQLQAITNTRLFGLISASNRRTDIRLMTASLLLLAIALLAACSSGVPEVESVVFTSQAQGGPGEQFRSDVLITRSAEEPPTRLTLAGNNDFSPKWSPNREQIAFISEQRTGWEIWVTDPQGTEKRVLFTELADNVRFEWAPDSRRIAYEAPVEDGRRQIFVGDVETGESTPLTSADESAHLGSWSPDGEWLVYTLFSDERSGIYRGNPDGVNEIEVSAAVPARDPRWSPNGRWIAFNLVVEGSMNIFVVPSGGGDETNLTPNAGENYGPVWAPDGNRLAFVSDRDGNSEIYVIDVNGRNERRLTSNRSEDRAPSWSKRTNRIAFMSDVDGDFDIFTMRPDGSNQRRLTSDDRTIVDLDW